MTHESAYDLGNEQISQELCVGWLRKVQCSQVHIPPDCPPAPEEMPEAPAMEVGAPGSVD